MGSISIRASTSIRADVGSSWEAACTSTYTPILVLTYGGSIRAAGSRSTRTHSSPLWLLGSDRRRGISMNIRMSISFSIRWSACFTTFDVIAGSPSIAELVAVRFNLRL